MLTRCARILWRSSGSQLRETRLEGSGSSAGTPSAHPQPEVHRGLFVLSFMGSKQFHAAFGRILAPKVGQEKNFSFFSWYTVLSLIISAANNALSLPPVSSLPRCPHRSNTLHQNKAVGLRGLHLAFEGCDSKLSNNTVFIAFPRIVTVATKIIQTLT